MYVSCAEFHRNRWVNAENKGRSLFPRVRKNVDLTAPIFMTLETAYCHYVETRSTEFPQIGLEMWKVR